MPDNNDCLYSLVCEAAIALYRCFVYVVQNRAILPFEDRHVLCCTCQFFGEC